MYLITIKRNKIIQAMGKQLGYMSNGYPRLIEENIAFPSDLVNVHEVEAVPGQFEPGRYCYTPEQGFYMNPDWQEPNKWNLPNEVIEEIKNEAIAEVQEGARDGQV